MRLESIHVENFRLLQNVELSLEDVSTVIVGRNNSGKTSLTELFYRLTEKTDIVLEDFTLSRCEDFWTAFTMHENGASEEEVREKVPTIKVTLKLSYDKAATDLGIMGDFIVDLDPASSTVKVEIQYAVDDGKLVVLLGKLDKETSNDDEKRAAFYAALKERIPANYKSMVEAVDPGDDKNRKLMDMQQLKRLIRFDFINAQRPVDNEKGGDGNALSKLLEPIFSARKSKQSSTEDKAVVEQLTQAVADVQAAIDISFKEALERLLPSLEAFGYPGLNDSAIKTETNLDVSRLLKEHTNLFYAGSGDINLPERHNGLGTRNLIYILFRLYQAFKEYQVSEKTPATQLVFIEEPEAHLHPQMQEVFISQLASVRDIFMRDFNNNANWPVQFIVTTHSAHVANKADFRAIRYFLTKRNKEAHTDVKDLRLGLQTSNIGDDEKFLHKYLELTRSDLFFADKAILIEGQSERILLPRMIEKAGSRLKSQYVSTVEVGGAYAHIFFPFLKFLELKTLIITDLDTVGADGKKCPVEQGESTTNACIREWFAVEEPEQPDYTPATLVAKSSTEKTKDHIQIAYQIPESGTATSDCARSFEEAFIRANATLFPGKTPYEEAKKANGGKPDFALKYAVCDEEWNVPKYIKDGLDWLSKDPRDQVIATVTPVIEANNNAGQS